MAFYAGKDAVFRIHPTGESTKNWKFLPAMNLTPEGSSLLDAICDNLEQWDLYLIFADWLEDHDEPLAAECMRWCVNRKKRVQAINGNPVMWCWISPTKSYLSGQAPVAFLPRSLFELLSNRARFRGLDTGVPFRFKNGDYAYYLTTIDAILDLVSAWKKLRPIDRRKLIKSRHAKEHANERHFSPAASPA